MTKIKIQVNDEGMLTTQCGISLEAPRAVIVASLNKVGKTRSSSKIKFDTTMIALGKAKLPKGMCLEIVPNKDLLKRYNIIPAGSCFHFKGDCELSLPVIALDNTAISAGTPIAEVSLSFTNEASLWTRLRFLFSNVKVLKMEQDEQEDARD